MYKRIRYLYKRILKDGVRFGINDYSQHYLPTIIEEKDVYRNKRIGVMEDVWQFDLALPDLYHLEVWTTGEHFWKERHR